MDFEIDDVEQQVYPSKLKWIYVVSVAFFLNLNIQSLYALYIGVDLPEFLFPLLALFLEFVDSDTERMVYHYEQLPDDFTSRIVLIRLFLELIVVISSLYIQIKWIKEQVRRREKDVSKLYQLGSSYEPPQGIFSHLNYRRNGIPFYQLIILTFYLVQYTFYAIYWLNHRSDGSIGFILLICTIPIMIILLKGKDFGDSRIGNWISGFNDFTLLMASLFVILMIETSHGEFAIMMAFLTPLVLASNLGFSYLTIKQPIGMYIDDPESVNHLRFIRRESKPEIINKAVFD